MRDRLVFPVRLFISIISLLFMQACSIQSSINTDSVSIFSKALPVINSNNSSDVVLTGTCAANVTSFVILKPEPAQTVQCVSGVWQVTLDMSSVADGSVEIVTDQIDFRSGKPISFRTAKDTVAPTVTTLTLENGSSLTNKSLISYQVSGNKIAKVYVTEDSSCQSGGQWAGTSGTVSVSPGDGLKGYFVKSVDIVGNLSSCNLMSSIYLDQTPPVVTGLSDDLVVKGTKSWSWSCSDVNAPCEYRHQISQGVALSPVGTYGLVQTTSKSGDGTFYINVQAKDAAGNESVVKSVKVDLSSTLPLLLFASNPNYFNSNTANLVLTNYSLFDEIDISNSGDCTPQGSLPVVGAYVWNLTAGDGFKTISYRLKNNSTGNITDCNTASVTIDTAAPAITLLSSAAPTNFNTSNLSVNVQFSEAVSGFALSDILVTNGVASGLTGSGALYSFMVTPTAQGLVSIDLAAGIVSDVANNLNSNSSSLSRTFDNIQPSVSLSSLATDPTNSAFVVNAIFSESVTGFVATDVTLTNATISSFSGSGSTYSFTVTPISVGIVSVGVSANVATDVAGNNNTASSILSLGYDNVAPVISGITDDTSWKTSKTWNWSCDKACTYRFVVDTVSNTSPSGAYGSTVTTTQSSGSGTYYLHVEAKDLAGNTSVKHVSAKLDNTLPTSPLSLLDQVSKASLTDSPVITFATGSDAHSGLKKHQARVLLASNSSPVSSWVDFVSGSTLTGLSLTTNTVYKVEVVALDNVDNISSSVISDGWIADTVAPTVPTGLSSGSVPVSQTTTPLLYWSASSDGSGGVGVSSYEVMIYKSAGNVAISGWTTLTSGSAVSGLSLNQENYYFKVRAKDALGNTSAESVASASWTANVDPCLGTPTAGTVCASGQVYVGVFNGKTYYTTRSGCNDSATPTCAGGNDSVTKWWSSNAYPGTDTAGLSKYAAGVDDAKTGAYNTSLLAGLGAYPAASYCDAMSYGGATDWFLPNRQELDFLLTNFPAVGGGGSTYWSSTQGVDYLAGDGNWVKTAWEKGPSNSWSNSQKSIGLYVRCMRAN